MRPVLLVPGIYNSGSRHWQSLWQTQHTGVVRVEQADWAHPQCDAWVQAIDAAITAAGQPPIVVAHSLGCLALARWAASALTAVHDLLLVAVPDPDGPDFPPDAKGFTPVPAALTAPGQPARQAMLVSSSDDPYSTASFSAHCATAWGAQQVDLGAKGHINADSGLGDWPEGWAWVQRWRAA